MRSATTFSVYRLCLLALPLAACGGSAPVFRPMYTAEQLNAGAQMPPEEGACAAATSAPPAAPSAEEAEVERSPAGLRVINASPDRGAASVSVFLDGSEVAAVQGLAYRAIAGYVQLPPQAHPVSVRSAAANAPARPLLTAVTAALAEGGRYTAVVHGLAAGAPALALAVSQDSDAQPDAGKSRVRFFHALVGLGAVDVCTAATPARPAQPAAAGRPAQAAQPATPAQPVFTNVAYGAFATVGDAPGGYAEVPAGAPVTLQVRAQNARPCTGALRGSVRITPADRAVLTAVAVGRVVGAPAAPRQLLVCTSPADGAPTCTPTAIQ